MTTGAGTVKVLSYPEMELLNTLHAHTSACLSLELDPLGRNLVIGGSDALISIWDTRDWVSRHVLSEIAGAVRNVSLSFDGYYVCGGSDEGNDIQIVSSLLVLRGLSRLLYLHTRSKTLWKFLDSRLNSSKAHVGTGEYLYDIPTSHPAPCVAWHPHRYWIAYSGDPMGLTIVGPGGMNS